MLTLTLRVPRESWETVASLMVVQEHIWKSELHADMSNALAALLGINIKVARRILAMTDTTGIIGTDKWFDQFEREVCETLSFMYKIHAEVVITD